jgi:hypothetical protein
MPLNKDAPVPRAVQAVGAHSPDTNSRRIAPSVWSNLISDRNRLFPSASPYAREPRKLPVVLSPDEVVQFLEAVSS